MALFCAGTLLVSSVCTPMPSDVRAKTRKPVLSKKNVSVVVGKSKGLTVKYAKGWKITWKSKNKKIVKVKKVSKYNAKVYANKKGSTKVLAKVKKGRKSYSLSCKVKVTDKGKSTPNVTAGEPTDSAKMESQKPTVSPSEGTPSATATADATPTPPQTLSPTATAR